MLRIFWFIGWLLGLALLAASYLLWGSAVNFQFWILPALLVLFYLKGFFDLVRHR